MFTCCCSFAADKQCSSSISAEDSRAPKVIYLVFFNSEELITRELDTEVASEVSTIYGLNIYQIKRFTAFIETLIARDL